MRTKTISRDDLAGIVFQADFFQANPALQPLEQQVIECRAAYDKSKQESSCGCGGDPRTIFNCLDAVLTQLEALRAADPPALQAFVQYAANKLQSTGTTALVLYYRKTAEEPLVKVYFP